MFNQVGVPSSTTQGAFTHIFPKAGSKRFSQDTDEFDKTPISSPLPNKTNFTITTPIFNDLKFGTEENKNKSSYFNDPIHGNICMDGLCLKIIDTREFQRLRELKQLGTCDFVFPGATHTRFAHSIGVAFYAEQVVQNLKKFQPELGITREDILCVKIAGLCHDLGHGPFSHVFDGTFMQRVLPDVKVRHEDCSVEIFRLLLKKNNIQVSKYGLTDIDLTFIEEIIRGTKESERKGRCFEKFYLYDIVNNSRSGLDVDKLDYFQRDIKFTNVYTNSIQFQRFLEFGRVMKATPIENPDLLLKKSKSFSYESHLLSDEDDDINNLESTCNLDQKPGYMICYPVKMVGEALQLFMLRYHLHQKVYTHKSVKKVEYMLVDALELADPFIQITGSKTEENPEGIYRMSECYKDAEALVNLTDNVLYLIETSRDKNLKPAQDIIKKIRSRQFYTCLGKSVYTRDSHINNLSEQQILERILEIANNISLLNFHEYNDYDQFNIQSQDSFAPWNQDYLMKRTFSNVSTISVNSDTSFSNYIKAEDIIVEKMHIHYGLKKENPVNRMRFFPKDKDSDKNFIASQVKESTYETLLPRVFEELAVRVFCRKPEKSEIIARAFNTWCEENLTQNFPMSQL